MCSHTQHMAFSEFSAGLSNCLLGCLWAAPDLESHWCWGWTLGELAEPWPWPWQSSLYSGLPFIPCTLLWWLTRMETLRPLSFLSSWKYSRFKRGQNDGYWTQQSMNPSRKNCRLSLEQEIFVSCLVINSQRPLDPVGGNHAPEEGLSSTSPTTPPTTFMIR